MFESTLTLKGYRKYIQIIEQKYMKNQESIIRFFKGSNGTFRDR